jgi:hypothetical protein
MIRGREFHPIVEKIFTDVKGLNDSEQIQVNCPRCQEREGLMYPDGKYNLEINTAKRVFRCWKCEEPRFSGSLGKLIRLFGTKVDYELYKSYASIFQDYSYSEEGEEEIINVSLPSEMISFANMNGSDPDHFEAYNYLVNDRMIPRDTILKYRLGFCLEGRYANRIIVPSYDEFGDVNYFVARAYKSGMKPPYMNPKVDKMKIIFNEGLINWDSTIYLVEGAFEFLSFPVNVIPLLGKDLSTPLFYKLKERKPNIVILLDPDAYKTAIQLFFKLQTIYVGAEERVKIVKLPTMEDLDELRKRAGKKELLKALYGARGLTIDDYFSRKLHKPYGSYRRYESNSKYFRR